MKGWAPGLSGSGCWVKIVTLAVAGCVVAAAPLPGTDEVVAIIPLEEIARGQKGYGLSVFSGDTPERFEVEVLGVMQNLMPDTSYILTRLKGQGLEEKGVVAGMSGSPVFLDGRLAGAVAFAWPFSREAVAGVTPIEAMRRLRDFPGSPSRRTPAEVDLRVLAGENLSLDRFQEALRRLWPDLGGEARAAIQWSAAGFGGASLSLLRQGVGGLAPMGEAAPGLGREELAPGSAVAAVLIDGDLKLAATGTVTERRGEEVLAFGHPFLGLGPIRLPMAASEVVTVVSNQVTSFKIANLGPRVGAFEQDALTGIRGRLGMEAPMIPMSLMVQGIRSRAYRMELADLPQITPILLAISTLAGVDAASYAAGPLGIDLEARFALAGHGNLLFRQSYDGEGAVLQSAIQLWQVADFLLRNPFQDVTLEGVEVTVAQSPEPQMAALVAAHAERTRVRPGDRITVNLDLVPYRGEPLRRSVEVTIPEDLPTGKYFLLVGDGTTVDLLRFRVEPVAPVSFAQALDLLRSLHSRRELVVLGLFQGSGLAVAGEVMPRLPGSIQSLWSAAASGSAVPLRVAVAQTDVAAMPMPIQGIVRIDLEVRRREPLTEETTEEQPEEGSGEEDGPASPEIADSPPAPAPKPQESQNDPKEDR